MPVIGARVEIEFTNFELELGFPGGNNHPLLVLGYEAKVGFPEFVAVSPSLTVTGIIVDG
jgi:hypothetical protein